LVIGSLATQFYLISRFFSFEWATWLLSFKVIKLWIWVPRCFWYVDLQNQWSLRPQRIPVKTRNFVL
jgi:hypothetical protein